MRIAVSGTHFIGKTTFIEDFINLHTNYRREIEPYYKLHEEKEVEVALEPSLDSLIEQLDCSINQLNESTEEKNVIFDRCPIDFLAYAMCALKEDDIDINDSEVAERFDEIKEALDSLDLIVFLPISNENAIEYTEENPTYRRMADKHFKQIYREDLLDIFPCYNHPKVIEITGNPAERVRKLESYLI